MTHDQACARLQKLRAVTVHRGASPHEAATAARYAQALCARFGFERPPGERSERALAYASAAATDRRSPRSLRFLAYA